MTETADALLAAYRKGGISRGEVTNLVLERVDAETVAGVMSQLSPRIQELTIGHARALQGYSQIELDALEWTGRGPAVRLSAVAIAAVLAWARDHAAAAE